jgi:ABC-2 type transport system permease protein
MKFISIAIKDLKELLRDRRGLFMILIFPLFFMLVFGFAFGGMGQSNTPHSIAVINYDKGASLPFNNENVNYGNNLTTILENSTYEDSDVKLFNVNQTSESAADSMLKQRQIDAELIIPANFSESVVSLIESNVQAKGIPIPGGVTNVTSTIIIRGDTGYIGFGVSQGILAGVLGQYQDKLVEEVQNKVSGTSGAETPKFIESKVEAIAGTETFTSFDFLAPGMMVFAILLLATTVAASLTREVERGTLARLKLSRMRSFDLLFGGLIPWSLIAAVQVVILLIVAILIGFHWQGGLNSLLLAMIVGILGGIASVSLGMIIAAFAKNDRQAANLGTIITVPTSFLVGAFFQLPQVELGNLFGHHVLIYDILPWTHVLNALRAVLIFGGGWDSISYQVGAIVFLTAILFAIGVFLFSWTRLRPENA